MFEAMDRNGDANDPDPISRESAKVQCVVARAASSDLLNAGIGGGMVSFMGMATACHHPRRLSNTGRSATHHPYTTSAETVRLL